MRKILSVFLSFLMIFSLVCVMPAMAEAVVINACDVYDGGQGVGFYDNGKNGEADSLEYSGENQIILRAGEWAKYDISALGLDKGTYEVSVKRKAIATDRQRVFVDLFVDDDLCLKKNIAKNENTFSDMVLGEVYIDDTSETVKIVNSGIYNDFYLGLESVAFTYVNVEDTVTDNYEVSIHSFNILSDEKATQTDGEGAYFDAANMTLPTGNIIDGSSYIHHAGDWSKYSLEGVRPGVYSVYFEACSRLDTAYSITVDGSAVCTSKNFVSTGGYSDSREDLAGKIYLDGTQSEMKVQTNSNAIYIRGIRLKPAPLDTKLRVEAESPIPGGQNEAYYDNGTIPTRLDVLEINDGATGKTICHRTDEWVKYSISNLKPGKYSLDISSASIVEVALKVELDGEVQIKESLIPKQASYSDFKINRIGYLDITSKNEIIMKIFHVNEAVATYIDYFELTMVEPFEFNGISSNVSSDEEIPRGADVITIYTNNEVDEKTLESITLKTSGGKNINCVKALKDDKKGIVISLLESLDYSSDYEIDLSEVSDTFSQCPKENFIYFTTKDKAEDKGESSLSDVVSQKDGNKTVIRGNVLSSCGLLMGRREVTLKETAPDGTELKTQTAVTDENGGFEFTVSYKEGSMTGAYKYYISTDYAKEPKALTDTYYDGDANEFLCKELSGKQSREDAKNALILHKDVLGINAEGSGLSIDMNYVYDDFVNVSFDEASDISIKFNQSIVKEKINQAGSEDEVKGVIENREEGSLLNISYDIYDELSADGKDAVSEKIYLSGRLNAQELIAFIKKSIEDEVVKELTNGNPEISVIFPEVTEGFGGTVKIGFGKKAENITKIHLELSYTDGEVFENEPIVVESKIKYADTAVKTENGKITIDIEREYILDAIKDICEVTFTTSDGEEGEYDLFISGYSEFVLSSGKTAEIGFSNEVLGVFKVNAQPSYSGSSGSSSGSSSGGGGGGAYPVISLPVATETPVNNPTETPAPSGDFTDLEKVEWAKESIITLKNMGIISGKGDGTFAPDDAVSRAEFVKILLGASGIEAKGVSSFGDVSENDWFYPYVSKAFELGIITGDENGKFLPYSGITRQDMATISYRLLKDRKELELSEPLFADSDEISDYAKEAVGSLYASGMVSGVGDNMFAPKTTVSRAMAAKFAYNILFPNEKPVKTETVKERAGEREMTALLKGDKLTVKTSFDGENDLVQTMSGLLADNKTANGIINFGESKLVSKTDGSQKTLSAGVDECAPFNINRAYIGANHGAPYGVRVKSAHNKTYKDIGAVYKDEAGTEWTILRIESADTLLMLSENVGTSETEYSFVNTVKGKLTYVSDGDDKGDINVISATSSVQIFSATKITEKTVYAFVDGVGYILSDGENVNCDYIDIVEKYEIINPATVGEALRKQKPAGGYTENPDIATGKAMVKYNMTYRITPDGTVMSIFDHEIAQNIKIDFYGGVMAQERENVFGGGVYRYIPKTSSFKAENKEFDFTKSVNVTESDVPDITLSQLYWENENIAPDREVSYMRNTLGEDVVAFTDGYLPIFDAEPSIRAEKVNAWGFLYPTKKHYPYYVTSKAFDGNKITGAHIKGAGYKKYEDMGNDLSVLGSAICIPYENDVYLYVDYKKAGTDEIVLSDKLSGKNAVLVEKSENVSFEQNSDVINVTVNSSKNYGYIVLKIAGAGYGTGTYSKTNYSDKYTLN